MMGFYLLTGDVGAVFGAGAGGWVYERFGTRMPFLFKAVLAATASVFARRVRVRAVQSAPSQRIVRGVLSLRGCCRFPSSTWSS
jgi:hypothetical protein